MLNRLYKNRHSLSDAFNEFLQLGDLDHEIVATYAKELTRGSDQFAKVFYDYLLRFADTADVLRKFEKRGGHLDTLVRAQTRHLVELVSGDTSDDNAEELMRIGRIHYQHGIEPTWIMGAYLLYLRHLQLIMRTHEGIANAHRSALDGSVTKLLFRDMGLLVEGYWAAAPVDSLPDNKQA